MFWIICILGSLTGSDLLDYIFTILCGLQGFCITVANLTTTRVKCGEKTDDFGHQNLNMQHKKHLFKVKRSIDVTMSE